MYCFPSWIDVIQNPRTVTVGSSFPLRQCFPQEAIDEPTKSHEIWLNWITDRQTNALSSFPCFGFRRIPRYISDDNRWLRSCTARDIRVVTPNPNLGTSFPLSFLHPTELIPCSLEHGRFSFYLP